MKTALLLACVAAAVSSPSPSPAPVVDPDAVARRLEEMKAAHARELESAPEGPLRYALRLRQMSAEDQLVRLALMELPGDQWQGPVGKKLGDMMSAGDKANTAELKRLVARHGWPRRDTVGAEADDAAWLLVQHADLDRPFQKKMLALLDQLRRDGGTAEKHYAYLYDRVAVGEGRPQRYGTQGGCREGAWRPDPIEDEPGVHARRREAGIMSMAENVARLSASCGGTK